MRGKNAARLPVWWILLKPFCCMDTRSFCIQPSSDRSRPDNTTSLIDKVVQMLTCECRNVVSFPNEQRPPKRTHGHTKPAHGVRARRDVRTYVGWCAHSRMMAAGVESTDVIALLLGASHRDRRWHTHTHTVTTVICPYSVCRAVSSYKRETFLISKREEEEDWW